MLGEGVSEGGAGCSKCSVSPGPEIGPDGVEKVDISGPETTGRGRRQAVEKVRGVGRGQVVEGFEGVE